MVLIGRRQLRSNNSWMHNLPALVKGKDRCTIAGPPRRRRAARPRRRRPRPRQLELRRAGRPGRGDRRDHARRRLDPARLGPRRARRPDGRRRRARRRQLEPARAGRRRRALGGNAVLNGIPVEVDAPPTASPPSPADSARCELELELVLEQRLGRAADPVVDGVRALVVGHREPADDRRAVAAGDLGDRLDQRVGVALAARATRRRTGRPSPRPGRRAGSTTSTG